MLLTVQRDLQHPFFPRQIALLSTKQEGLDKGRQYMLLQSKDQQKYLPYALHPCVRPNSIVLPEFAAKSFHESVSCSLLQSLDDLEHRPSVTVSPLSAHLIASDAADCRIDGTVVTFDTDTISIRHRDDVVLCQVRQADQKGPFIVDDQTEVLLETNEQTEVLLETGEQTEVLLETDEQASSLLAPYLECHEYGQFVKSLQQSAPRIHIVRNLFFRMFPFYLQHLRELFGTVSLLRSFPYTTGDDAEAVVFMFTDAVCDDQDVLQVYRAAVRAIANGSRVLFLADNPPPANAKSLLDRERVSVTEFDFSLVDDSTKRQLVRDAPPYSLNGISMRGLLALGRDARQLADLQRAAWSLAGEVVDPTSVSWSAVFGFGKQVAQLQDSIYDSMDYKEQFKANRLGPPRGILLHGPSGCGKTLISRALAADRRLPVLSLPTMSLFSRYFGETEGRLRAAFAHARLLKPCVLLIDDVDIVAPKRDGCSLDTSGVSQRLLTTLLTELDGMDDSSEGVIVVACTSARESIDPAFLRPGRMDVHIEIGRPTLEDRRQLVLGLKTRLCCGSELDVDTLVDKSDGHTCAQVCAMFQRAGWRAAARDSPQVSMDDFID